MGKYNSQNNEAEIVINYFNGFVGHLFDIGANDGITFSNSYDLIHLGWAATLFEPSPQAFDRLKELYKGKTAHDLYSGYESKCGNGVHLIPFAIGSEDGEATLWESGAHIKNGNDVALVSSMNPEETERWRKSGVTYHAVTINVMSFYKIWQNVLDAPNVDFISIDCEGEDLNILQQIDLIEVGCKCLCIEFNGDINLANLFTSYCAKFNLKEIHRNAENLIFAII